MSRFLLAAVCALVLSASTTSAQVVVSGRVTNGPGGPPIANADVTLRPLPGSPAAGMPKMPNMPSMPATVADKTVQSGTDGSFSFSGVTAGPYVLQVDLTGFERASQQVDVTAQPRTVAVQMVPLEVPRFMTPEAIGVVASAAAAPTVVTPAGADSQALIERIRTLEQRISDLESGAVLSEPETRVKRIEVYKDANGVETDEPRPGAKKVTTYQRERVYRRQWLSEKLEQSFADQDAKKIAVGVSAASVTQFASQTQGPKSSDNRHAYQLSSADLFFSGGLAQYTSFFADIVGLSGAPPDAEIPGLTLLNSYTARLVRQNEVNVREAWLRTELFSQKLAISAGRLDLTNYFDRNAAANDETSQFISDALVNNPMLGLASNGAGVAAVFDPKNGLALKAGFQQSNSDATNLSESLFTLAEVDYLAHIPGLAEGNYRLWFRTDNSSSTNRTGVGISVDQKVTNVFGLFGRWGSAETDPAARLASLTRDRFWSAGFQIQNGAVFNPLDYWGVGFAQTELVNGNKERMVEGYYNFELSGKLRLSFHLQHQFERTADEPDHGFLIPAVRLQARF